MDQIDHVYETIYVQESIIVCDDEAHEQTVRAELEARDYPMDRILVTTFNNLHFQNDYNDKITVIFTFNLDVIGYLCEFGCPLVVALNKNVDPL